ncbi:MAG: ribosome biogenesis GTPase Der, partial [Leptospiraceae bacterium]|nr:ribosome biogenesis GTPase Der [Leptospiraceae bacterium]
MNLPKVSIVGRQNVGKSTLFNTILKKKIAITHDYPGVTRDVLQILIDHEEIEKKFFLCDTPGLDIEDLNDLTSSIIELSFKQLLDSDVIVFLIDIKDIREYDFKLIRLFREDPRFQSKNIIYCANKADNPNEDYNFEILYKEGISEVLPISALGRRNIKLLLEKIIFYLKDVPNEHEVKKADFKIAIVGKPNSGKSSLLNAFLGYNRVAVSKLAGTTRDSINATIFHEGKQIEIVDTAGIRKISKKTKDSLEFYSYTRAVKSIEEADLVIHLIDATKGIGEFDKKIFSMIYKQGKPLIFAVNKWDLIEDKDGRTFDTYKSLMIQRFHPASEVKVMSISAAQRQRVQKLLSECINLFEKTNLKIPTNELNKKLKGFLSEAKFAHNSKKVPKLLYATQVSSSPFKVILFVNHEDLFKTSVLNYLKKKIASAYQLQSIP